MPCPIPLFYEFIIISLLIRFAAYASAYDEQPFTECAPFNCGSFSNIGYPFRLPNGADDCGHPGIEVNCVEEEGPFSGLFMTIKSIEYKVEHIEWEKQRLTIIRRDFLSFDHCPEQYKDTDLDHCLFDYVSGDGSEHATLYYDCKGTQIDDPYRFSCKNKSDNVNRDGYLLFDAPDLCQQQHLLSEGCDYNISFPLRKRPVVQHEMRPWMVQNSIAAALHEGFEVRWKVDVDLERCQSCNSSGGRCGYNTATNESDCFCREGFHQKSFPQPGSIKGLTENSINRGSGNKCQIIIGVAIGAGGLAFVLAAFFFYYQRRTRSTHAPTSYTSRSFSSTYSSRTDFEKGGCYGLPCFDYEGLREATNNFDQKREVGDGGFGTVYKGKLRDGRVVAIKSLYENNYKRQEQFMSEVEILARLRHPNLAILYGCTSPHSQRFLLVYEYISNGTVADHLHGDQAKPGSLPWLNRLNIAIETASALHYLHRSDVIHRDVKTNNILLDDNFSVKVADFGLSRLFPFNVTHASTAPQGTQGYVDPEYCQCYQLTEKSDVYSFGVVLIELISSLPAVDITRHRHEKNLSTMAINKIQGGALHELVDKHLGFDCDDNTRRMITAVAELAFRCLQNANEMRPCMEEVLETLKTIQKQDKTTNESAEMDSLSDDAVLLKGELMHPTDSVTLKLDSALTTPNASG